MPNVKECPSCLEVLPFPDNYYPIGKSYTKRCKKCHNKLRKTHARKPATPKPKLTPFQRLSPEAPHELSYGIYVKRNMRTIHKNLVEKHGFTKKYDTVCLWKRKGIIAPYVDTDE